MRAIQVLFVGVLMGFLSVGDLEGQDPLESRLGLGVRIKIAEGQPYSYGPDDPTVGSGQFVSGILHSVSDTLTVLTDIERGVEIRVPTESIEAAQIKSGQRTHGRRGFGFGFLVGAIGGGIYGWGEGMDDTSSCWIFCLSRGESASLGAIAFGIGGGIIGATIGAFIKTDQWDSLALPAVSGSIQTDGGFGLEVTIPVGFNPGLGS